MKYQELKEGIERRLNAAAQIDGKVVRCVFIRKEAADQ